MLPEDRIRLQHLIAEAEEACKFIEGITFDEFVRDGRTVRAVIRSIEVIGEAASKISPDLRNKYPDIPWPKIIGMRNRLIHVYFDIDYEIVWKTVTENIPLIINYINAILKES